jgi:hypothetical protein
MIRLGSQLVALSFIIQHLSDELKNCSVLSQSTYWMYQLHWASLQEGQYTSQLVASKVEQTSNFTCADLVSGEFKTASELTVD